MNRRSPALVLMLALPAVAAAVDVPVAGKRLDLNASRDQARARVVVADPALAAPLPDPAIGAALIVNAGAAAGQCRAEILLDPGKWQAIGGDGPRKGWRYRAEAPGTQGVRRILLRPGLLTMQAQVPAGPAVSPRPSSASPSRSCSASATRATAPRSAHPRVATRGGGSRSAMRRPRRAAPTPTSRWRSP